MSQNLQLLGDTQRTVYWFWTAVGWVSMVQEVFGTILLAVVAGIIGYRASAGALSPGIAGLALSLSMNMPRDLMWLSRQVANMEVEFVALERVLEYVRLKPEEEAHQAVAQWSVDADPPTCADCAIIAENLQFRYGPESSWVLDRLSLRIKSGSRVALVGRTGCGKSTFLSLIVRLYPPSGGKLMLHGHDVMQTPLVSLRSTVRVLLQDPIFFAGTVRSNLLCQPPPLTSEVQSGSSEEGEALWRVLTQVRLQQRVAALSGGLDARVEEAGQNFSQGERQLLCLARVLVGHSHHRAEVLGPRVLLCDEPTSACDLAADECIHGTLLHGLPGDCTLVVVCHRLHRVHEFDRVFVFDAGTLAEEGPPHVLTSRHEGVLTALCEQQHVKGEGSSP